MRFKTAAMALLAGLVFASPMAQAAPESHADDRAAIQKVLLGDRIAGPVMREVKQEFPDSFNELLDKLVALLGDPDAKDKAAPVMYETMHRLSQAHLLDAASAPDDEIDAFLAGQAALTQSLHRENATACADYFMSGKPTGAPLSPRSMSLFSDASIALLHAIRAGIDHPTARQELGEKDVDALRHALEAAHVRGDIASALLSQGGVAKLSKADQCEASSGFYEALTSLPPDIEARWGATILIDLKDPS